MKPIPLGNHKTTIGKYLTKTGKLMPASETLAGNLNAF